MDPNFVYLKDALQNLPRGKFTEIQGSGSKPYKLTHHEDGAYSCSCPAWRNQSAPGLTRTCKHLKQLRGFQNEEKRIHESDFERLARSMEDLPVGDPNPLARPAPPLVQPVASGTFQNVLLAEKWTPLVDPTGYWMSEKLDGVRAYWDGSDMFSRNGNRFDIPDWFRVLLPRQTHTDGELYAGPGRFNEAVSIVRSGRADPQRWRNIRYMVFDLPEHPGVFEDRMRTLDHVASTLPFLALRQVLCTSPKHLKQFHDSVKMRGIEGTMLREANSYYERKRSSTLLKVKDFVDCEARVVGYVAGAGRHKGRLGAYEAELPDGTRFSVGTGLSDKDREKPVRVGTQISVRYQELTAGGVPRFPVFLAVRNYE